MKNTFVSILLSLTFLLSLGSVLSIASLTQGPITIISPAPNQHYVPGQPLIVDFSSPNYPNTGVTVNLENSTGGIITQKVGSTDAHGNFNATLLIWPFPQQKYGQIQIVPGNYTVVIALGNVYTASISVSFSYPQKTIVVTVLDALTKAPIAGATVSAINASAPSSFPAVTATTSSSGTATLQVPAVPGVSNSYKVTVTAPGYSTNTTVVTLPASVNTTSITVYLSPTTLLAKVIAYQVNGQNVVTSPPYTTAQGKVIVLQPLFGYVGETVSVILKVTVGTSPVLAFVQGYIGTSTITAVAEGGGIYNLTFTIPTFINGSIASEGTLLVNVTYQSQTVNLLVPVLATYNFQSQIAALQAQIKNLTAQISALNAELASLRNNITLLNSTFTAMVNSLKTQIASLNNTVNSLNSTVMSLQSSIASLKTQIASLNNTVSSLSGEVSSLTSQLNTLRANVSALSSQISTLQSRINDLNNKFSTLSTITYASLALGVIALVISIVALILVLRVMRKVSP